MKNVAYTKDYQDYRNKYDYIFTDEYLQDTKIIELSDDYSLKVFLYLDESKKIIPYRAHCCFSQLIYKGKIIYSTKNIDDEGFLFELIKHKNGIQYLVFKIDLYGYSILDLNSMKDYHYIPEESFKGSDETFIWTGIQYNKDTNLLIAEGCYWACPYEILVIDFSEPVNLPFPELRINEYLNTLYEEIEFQNWDSNNNLIIKYCDIDSEYYGTKIVEKDICINILNNEMK